MRRPAALATMGPAIGMASEGGQHRDHAEAPVTAAEGDPRPPEREGYFRTLVESIDQAMCVLEILFEGEVPTDCRLLYANSAFERQTGIGNAVGRRLGEMLPGYRSLWLDPLGRVAQTGEPVRFQRESEALGRYYDVHAFRVGAPEQRRVGVLFSDITDRARAERALREAEEKLRAAVANASIGFSIGAPDGRIVDANPAFCRLTGHELEEIRDKPFIDLIHPDDRASTWEHIEPMFRGDTPGFTTESRYVHKDGFPVWVRKSVSMVRSDDGKPRWIIVLCEDISDRMRARELRDTNDRLEQANREKTQFLAMLSHELRNPLAPIMYALDILEQTASGGERERRARAVIGRQTKQLTRLVNDLLDVTRMSRGKIALQLRRVDLTELVRQTLEDHRVMFDRTEITVESRLPFTPVLVDADTERTVQVVGNLLQNAVKFTPTGGHVTVSLTVDPVADQAVLSVLDTGVGIEPSVLPRIFEPFVQADQSLDRSKSGLGLGLSLVKGLVEHHGGSVEVRSPGRGGGTEIVVRLPLATPPSP